MHMSGTDLAKLVESAVAGDRDAWDRIVDEMNDMVWSVVRGFRLSDSDAVDAAQMTWLRAVESLHKVNEPERFGLWLATTARRECIRLIERRSRAVPVDPHTSFTRLLVAGDLQGEQISRADAQRVLDALATLGEECQALLRLVLTDPPMSYNEIAAALDIPVGTIGPRRQRCLQQLRAAAGL